MLNRRIGRQPSAGARKIQAIGPPRGAAGQLEDFSAISPDAEISPYRRPIDLQAGVRHPSLRAIIPAMDEESAQARPPDGGAREDPRPANPCSGLNAKSSFRCASVSM